MDGVGYGQDYGLMNDYDGLQTSASYVQTLSNNKERSSKPGPGTVKTMKIQLSTSELYVHLNGRSLYDPNCSSHGNCYLYLQSHWGSGVIFTFASLQLNQ